MENNRIFITNQNATMLTHYGISNIHKLNRVIMNTSTKVQEIWKDIPNYEGLYQASNLGRVKSLYRITIKKNGQEYPVNEKILNPIQKENGYLSLTLFKNHKRCQLYVHQIIAMAFLNHIPNGNTMVCDHINNIKTDNRLLNIQVIPNRENTTKDVYRKNPKCKYPGVTKDRNRFRSRIHYKGKRINLGTYSTEDEAYNAYLNFKNNI